MARLLIDGYNLLPTTDYPNREKLISVLADYRKSKNHEITVVFDGTHQGTGTGDRTFSTGIEVIFSPITVQADDVIEEILTKPKANEWIVVSSDRRIQSAAKRARATFISSQEFAKKLRQPHSMEKMSGDVPPWMEGREDEMASHSAGKTGQTKKLSKEDRQRRKRMEKL